MKYGDLYTTLRLLHEARACEPRYKHLAKALGGIKAYGKHTPITLRQIAEANSTSDAMWAAGCAMPSDLYKAGDDIYTRWLDNYFRERLPEDIAWVLAALEGEIEE